MANLAQNVDSATLAGIELLGKYTIRYRGGSSFDPWDMMGPHNAKRRAEVMSALMGKKMPQAKSGVTALRDELNARLNPVGNHLSARQENLADICRELLEGGAQ